MGSAVHLESDARRGESPLPVRVYSPESALRRPGELFREMFRDLWSSRELAWRLFVRDISARYRQSLLGYVWAFLPPIASTLTFVILNRSGILRGGDERIPYPLFVIIGTLLWQIFADAVNNPITTVTAAKPMLSKINFPREAILLSSLLQVMFNFAIRAVLLIPAFAYYGLLPARTVPLALLGAGSLLCLGFMIGVMLTPIGLLYVDIGNALGVGLSFWMLVTPVIYAPPSAGVLAVLTKFNPVSPLVVTTREWLVVGSAGQVWPMLAISGGALVLLFAAWLLYRLAMPILVERMGG